MPQKKKGLRLPVVFSKVALDSSFSSWVDKGEKIAGAGIHICGLQECD